MLRSGGTDWMLHAAAASVADGAASGGVRRLTAAASSRRRAAVSLLLAALGSGVSQPRQLGGNGGIWLGLRRLEARASAGWCGLASTGGFGAEGSVARAAQQSRAESGERPPAVLSSSAATGNQRLARSAAA